MSVEMKKKFIVCNGNLIFYNIAVILLWGLQSVSVVSLMIVVFYVLWYVYSICASWRLLLSFVSGHTERRRDGIVVFLPPVVSLWLIIFLLSLYRVSVSVLLSGDLCFCLWSLISSCIISNGPIGTHRVSVAL